MNATGSSAVLSVSDFQAALAFYRDVLEFTIEFEFGEYAGVKTGDASLHLSSGNPKSPGSGHVYFFCDKVDDYFHLIKQSGASIRRPIEDSPYGMRDFEVEDLDGNILVFGCNLEDAA
jgi:uncharacterized glyoxalase superfamily protein PhnB